MFSRDGPILRKILRETAGGHWNDKLLLEVQPTPDGKRGRVMELWRPAPKIRLAHAASGDNACRDGIWDESNRGMVVPPGHPERDLNAAELSFLGTKMPAKCFRSVAANTQEKKRWSPSGDSTATGRQRAGRDIEGVERSGKYSEVEEV